MFGVKVVVGLLPLPGNRFRSMASKIVKSTKLSKDGSLVESVACRIPLNTALPVVVVGAPVLAPTKHDASSVHA